ncbi:N-glycosylase/DNA lyase [soil metagenome]
MAKSKETLTIDSIKAAYKARRGEIRSRLAEFNDVWNGGTDDDIWAEMVFCFFTGGCSAKMGLRSLEAVRHLLASGTQPELAKALTGVHRYPNARARYVVASRDHLRADCGFQLKERLATFDCHFERRDWLAREKGIKGLGYKEASHFLRNVGFRGYAILDKHVLNCLAELGIISEPKPPSSRKRYLETEDRLRELSLATAIDFDEMDLVLWSMKTGEVLK